jgi:hypothetical protein
MRRPDRFLLTREPGGRYDLTVLSAKPLWIREGYADDRGPRPLLTMVDAISASIDDAGDVATADDPKVPWRPLGMYLPHVMRRWAFDSTTCESVVWYSMDDGDDPTTCWRLSATQRAQAEARLYPDACYGGPFTTISASLRGIVLRNDTPDGLNPWLVCS